MDTHRVVNAAGPPCSNGECIASGLPPTHRGGPTRRDIPRLQGSSGVLKFLLGGAPGGVLVVGSPVAQAAVEDADPLVGQGRRAWWWVLPAVRSVRSRHLVEHTNPRFHRPASRLVEPLRRGSARRQAGWRTVAKNETRASATGLGARFGAMWPTPGSSRRWGWATCSATYCSQSV